jgi:hypothetical protein
MNINIHIYWRETGIHLYAHSLDFSETESYIYWRETGIHLYAHFLDFSGQNYTVSVIPVELLSQFSAGLKT